MKQIASWFVLPLALLLYQSCEPVAESWLGVNLESAKDWQPNNMFADAMKMSRQGWGSPSTPWDLTAPVDANGWPTGDAGIVVKTNAIYHDIGGTYALSFTGSANVAGVAPTILTVQNMVYNPNTDSSTADVVVDNSSDGIMLSFTGTSGGVRNVKLIRPGYTTETFTRPFLDLIQPFSCLRYMWFSETINSPVVNWADRTLPSYSTQNRKINGYFAGAAWEYAVELANQTYKDMWVNIPDQATDDYILQFATFLKNSLDPDLKIYVEYSNEVWNTNYLETPRNLAAAEAEVAAGGSPLNYDGNTDHNYWAWRRVGKKTKEISDIFRSVFGDSEMMMRIRPILCAQNVQSMMIRQPLEFIEAVYGPPGAYIYGISSGQYFGIPRDWNTRTDLTVDEILGSLPASIATEVAAAKAYITWAHYYNLKFMTYEGGFGLTGTPSLAAKIVASHDPRIQGILVSFLDQFNQAGGDYFTYYTSVSTDNQNGTFGLTDNVNDLTTPKYQAVLQQLDSPRAEVTAGVAVPATVSAGNFDTQSQWATYGTSYVQMAAGTWFNYLIRVPSAGTYALTASVAANAAGGRLQALLNSNSITTWDVPNSGGLQNWTNLPAANIELQAGLNVIRMNRAAGSFNLQSFNLGSP